MKLGGHTIFAFPKVIKVATLFFYPVRIIMTFFPVIPRGMTKFPVVKSVIDPGLSSFAGALQVEFPDHSTVIPSVCNEFTNHGRPVRKTFVSVTRVMDPARVESTHETCPTGSADRALAIGVGEGGPFGYQLINDRSANERIPKSANGVKALLVGAVPKDVRMFIHFKIEDGGY